MNIEKLINNTMSTKTKTQKVSKGVAPSTEKSGKTEKSTKSVKNEKLNTKVDKKNAENISGKITDKKDLKYIYPKDVDTLPKRKKFRTNARKKIERFAKNLKKLQKAGDKESLAQMATMQKEHDAWLKTTLAKS